jgi:hypothetical protein
MQPPFGLDPIVFACLVATPVVLLTGAGVLVALVVDVAIVLVMLAVRRTRAQRFLRRHPDVGRQGVRPTLVVYLRGLGDFANGAAANRWLWDVADAPPLPVRQAEPPTELDLGTDEYVDAVVPLAREELDKEGARVLFVGNSRGAGVLLKALDRLRRTPPLWKGNVAGAVFLSGPFDDAEHVAVHRYGSMAGKWLARYVVPRLGFRPLTMPPPADPLPYPCLFVLSKGDTSLSPDGIRAAHVAAGGTLVELVNAPHSMIWATDADLLTTRRACDTMLMC